jgi:predicted RNA methylase
MRLEGQIKGGYFAAPPEAVAFMARYLTPPASGEWSCLDPCAGKGAAIAQIAAALNCHPVSVHAIELDETRCDDVRAALPEARVLAPCDFFRTSISSNSLGFAWVNPPFDNEGDQGRRVELGFLQRISKLLAPNGILALVCPEDVSDNWQIDRHLRENYDQRCTIPFPADHRPYNEVVVFGRRLPKEIGYWESREKEIEDPQPGQWHIPQTKPPLTFAKTDWTDAEFHRALDRSPLQTFLQSPPETELARPPLPLGKGHKALLIASGYLDGMVCPPNEPPHVVRGTCKKIKYISSVEEKETSDGGTATVTTWSERISLVVRTLESDGTLTTLQDDPDANEKPTATDDDSINPASDSDEPAPIASGTDAGRNGSAGPHAGQDHHAGRRGKLLPAG